MLRLDWSAVVFFFFKQKTAYEILRSDWSSDVCSSDLSTHEPAAGSSSLDRKIAEGLDTPLSPPSVIANAPSSLAAPKRFFTDRIRRKRLPEPHSKYSTPSTMCSSTRGPARAPSLVTWPTSTTVQPVCLAYWTSLDAHSRTWATAPGADCNASLHSV